jgi:transcriptional regulator with XRE-family HTH domain
MDTTGRRISTRMREVDYTQQRLASETGIDQHKISDFINDKKEPLISEYHKLSTALQCDIAALIPGSVLYSSIYNNINNSESVTQNYYTIDKELMRDLLKENGKLQAQIEALLEKIKELEAKITALKASK